MKRPRILLDCDGVLAAFAVPCLDAVRTHTGLVRTEADITDWDIMKSLNIDAETGEAIYKSMERPGLCMSIPPYFGAVEGVAELAEFADIRVVTSPFGGAHWMHERDAWLEEYMKIPPNHVMHVRSGEKFSIWGDAFVEDKTSTLTEWEERHPSGIGVLFKRRYNENDIRIGLTADSWPDLVSVLKGNLC